jgi:hypothetical protein
LCCDILKARSAEQIQETEVPDMQAQREAFGLHNQLDGFQQSLILTFGLMAVYHDQKPRRQSRHTP